MSRVVYSIEDIAILLEITCNAVRKRMQVRGIRPLTSYKLEGRTYNGYYVEQIEVLKIPWKHKKTK